MQWYEQEVRELEQSVAARVNGGRPPVFYGSSSIRMWETLAEDVDPGVVNLQILQHVEALRPLRATRTRAPRSLRQRLSDCHLHIHVETSSDGHPHPTHQPLSLPHRRRLPLRALIQPLPVQPDKASADMNDSRFQRNQQTASPLSPISARFQTPRRPQSQR
jgi:hypothetical protein